ncbi:MAG: hypothetical protein GX969_07420 [Firmicutes bacterium]|nr:hypothetical protein [Bacillota bacterium]
MKENDIKRYRDRLLSERDRLKQRINLLRGKTKDGVRQSMKNSIGELSFYDNHPADISSEVFEQEKDIKFYEDTKIILNRLNKALELMDTGKYGTCHNCGDNIERERLDLIPYTHLCSKCQEDITEETTQRRDRPVEEEVLEPPFAKDIHGSENPGINRGDVWRHLEKYGTASGPQDLIGIIESNEVFGKGKDSAQGAVEEIEIVTTDDRKVSPGKLRKKLKRNR